MLTKKILKAEDDPKRRVAKGTSWEERDALREFARSGQRHGFHITAASKKNSGNRRRSQITITRPTGARPRHQHLADARLLVEYLLEGSKGEGGAREHPDGLDRVEQLGALNLGADDRKIDAAAFRELGNWMGETAALNVRAQKSAFFHYVISIHPGEEAKIDEAFWKDTAIRTVSRIGLDEHQALFVVHKDTDARHMHLMVNRVHPTRHTVRDPLRDLIKLEQLNRELEKEYGLTVDRGRHIDPHTLQTYDWDAVRRGEIQVPGSRRQFNRIEREKFIRQIKKDLARSKPFTHAQSWEELVQRLRRFDYHLEAKGRGLVIADAQGNEAKVTAVAGKGNGRQKLEDRFGRWVVFAESHEREREEKIDQAMSAKAISVGTFEDLDRDILHLTHTEFADLKRELTDEQNLEIQLKNEHYLMAVKARMKSAREMSDATDLQFIKGGLESALGRHRSSPHDGYKRFVESRSGAEGGDKVNGKHVPKLTEDLREIPRSSFALQHEMEVSEIMPKREVAISQHSQVSHEGGAVLIDPEAGKDAKLNYRQSMMSMSPERLHKAYVDTLKVQHLAKRLLSQKVDAVENAGRSLCAREGLRALKSVMKERGIEEPTNPYKKEKAKTKSKGISL